MMHIHFVLKAITVPQTGSAPQNCAPPSPAAKFYRALPLPLTPSASSGSTWAG